MYRENICLACPEIFDNIPKKVNMLFRYYYTINLCSLLKVLYHVIISSFRLLCSLLCKEGNYSTSNGILRFLYQELRQTLL